MDIIKELPQCLAAFDELGRAWRINLSAQCLGVRSDFVAAAANAAGIIVRDIAKLGGLRVHLLAGSPSVSCVRLPCLKLNCNWDVVSQEDGPHLLPAFLPRSGERATKLESTMEWVPPDGFGLYFLGQGNLYFLVLIGPGPEAGGRVYMPYRLPLPNLYDDCHLCLGTHKNLETTVVEHLARALMVMAESHWNADLFNDNKRRACSNLIRFTPDGKPAPLLAPVRDCCPMVSSAAFNWLAAECTTRGGLI